MRWQGLILTFLIALMNWAGEASAQNRVALVIGNDGYEHISPLRKARADAKAYAGVLREKGFNVREGYDLSFLQLNATISSFVTSVQPGDTAVFVYSGHGWSDGSQNYLVSVDAPVSASEDELAGATTPIRNGVNGVLDRIERRGAQLRVAIIDACRDNPFTPPPGQRGYSFARGLAPMAQPPQGTFVVFSASAGQTALDSLSEADTDLNSVFTRVFLPLLRSNASLQEATKASQEKVVDLARMADHEQKPSYWDEVVGSACLTKECGAEFRLRPMQSENEGAACDKLVNETASTDDILKIDAEVGLQACARATIDHPEEAHLTHLLQIAQEQRALQRALRSSDQSISSAFLALYPSSRYADAVRLRLASLTSPPLKPIIRMPAQANLPRQLPNPKHAPRQHAQKNVRSDVAEPGCVDWYFDIYGRRVCR